MNINYSLLTLILFWCSCWCCCESKFVLIRAAELLLLLLPFDSCKWLELRLCLLFSRCLGLSKACSSLLGLLCSCCVPIGTLARRSSGWTSSAWSCPLVSKCTLCLPNFALLINKLRNFKSSLPFIKLPLDGLKVCSANKLDSDQLEAELAAHIYVAKFICFLLHY